jgi:hypothetical protein
MRDYLNLDVCPDCLIWIANGDDADGTYLDTDPEAAAAEVNRLSLSDDPADERRADDLRDYRARVKARNQWARDGWTLTAGHAFDWPAGHPGAHPGGLDTPPELPRGADAADARKLAGDFRALADCAWAEGEGAGLGAESDPATRWGDRAADYADALEAGAAEVDANETDDGGFSWSSCDCCDDWRAGNRHRAAAIKIPGGC